MKHNYIRSRMNWFEKKTFFEENVQDKGEQTEDLQRIILEISFFDNQVDRLRSIL